MVAINLSDLLMLSVNGLEPARRRCAETEATRQSKKRLPIFFAAAKTSSDRIFFLPLFFPPSIVQVAWDRS